MTETPDISDLIRELRLRLGGLIQEQFAARLGVTFPTVNRWENGRSKPSPIALKLVRDAVQQLGENGQDLISKYFPH